MANLKLLDTGEFTNTIFQPFTTLSSSAIKLSSHRIKSTELVFAEKIVKINGRNFFPPFGLRRISFLADNISHDPNLKFHATKHIKFYAASEDFYRYLINQGISKHCVFLIKKSGHFFRLNQGEIVSLTNLGRNARVLLIPSNTVKICSNVLNHATAFVIDFTKIEDADKFTIEGKQFAGLNCEYKVNCALMAEKLIQAGACARNIQNVDYYQHQKSNLPLVIVSLCICLPVCIFLFFGVVIGISYYKSYKQQK